jgi:hypothetical protein
MPTRQGDAGVHQTGPRAWEERARGFILVWPDVAGGNNRKVEFSGKAVVDRKRDAGCRGNDVGDLRRFMDLNLNPSFLPLYD